MEAILRGCKPIYLSRTSINTIVCEHKFHRDYLEENRDAIEAVFGGPVEVCLSVDKYLEDRKSDPLIAWVLDELEARIVV